ncbi:MAG: DUF308 domain-containing protein [Alphaproteobacteria bacterium]|nr:DUF308 domain-containing protein [Alphaproteobacteria bacterium]
MKKVVKFGALVNKIYRNTAPLLLAEACLFVIMSVLMLVKPVEFLSAVTAVIGGVLVLFGLYRVSMVFVSNLGFGIGSFDVFFGLVTMILGIVFLAYPNGATVGVIYVFVVLFLLNALRMLFFAINMLRLGFGYYMMDLIAAIVMICLSVALLILPNFAIGIVVVCLAIYLVLYAAFDLYMFWKLYRLRRAVRRLQ